MLSSEKPHSDEKHNESTDHDDRFVRQGVVVYDELLERYETSGLCEQILDRLLKDVNASIGNELVSGSKVSRAKCNGIRSSVYNPMILI